MHFSLVLTLLSLGFSIAQSDEKSVVTNRKHLPSTSSPLPSVLIDSIRQQYLTVENDLWNLIDSGIDASNVLEQIHGAHLKFFDQTFNEFNVTFDDSAFDQRTQLFNIVTEINQTVLTVVKNSLRENSLAFNEKAAIYTNRYQIDLSDQLDTLFNLTSTKDFYETIKKKAELKQCDKNVAIIKSANQLIYEYYHDITTAELKAYALVQLAYMFYTVYNRGNYRRTAQGLRAKYLDRTHQTQEIAKHFLEYSKRDIWRCDPNRYTVGTYEEVTNFLQGYIDNEVNLHPDQNCGSTCTDYQQTKNFGCYEGTFCANKPERVCKGSIVDCEFIGSDLNVCSSPNDFSRRYDVLYFDNGNVLGRNGTDKFERCADESVRITSWTRWLVKCSNCFCLCDDKDHSERHFSLRDVVSDISQNRVVSAVALRKFQGIFHLVVVERELKPYATLDITTPSYHTYNNVEFFHIHDKNIREGIDYHTLTWENRTINLDTVQVPTGKVVTGVRFRVVNGAITLQVRATDFDITSGVLKNIGSSAWYFSDRKDRTEIPMDNLDIPILTPEKSIPNILPVLYVKFGPTDKFMDLAQTTIPFVDAQLVESHNPTPLSGVGLYYKAFQGYGGFIAPKILNYNLGPHITKL